MKSFSVKNSRICGNHFEETSFKSCFKSQLLAGVKLCNSLEKSALLPTLNLHGLRRECSASHAAQIQSRKRLIEELLGKISIKTLTSILVSIKSTRALFAEVKAAQIPYLILCKVNTDPVENYFSHVRGIGGDNSHPGPATAVYRMIILLIGKDPQG